MRFLIVLFLCLPSLLSAQSAATLVADDVSIIGSDQLVADGNIEVFYDGTRLSGPAPARFFEISHIHRAQRLRPKLGVKRGEKVGGQSVQCHVLRVSTAPRHVQRDGAGFRPHPAKSSSCAISAVGTSTFVIGTRP